jgi:capsular polysaccharide biosynthesis protein
MDDNSSNREKSETLAPESPSKVVIPARSPTNGGMGSNVVLALVRGFWLIILGIFLGAGAASLVSQLVPPVYRSDVHLLVVATADGDGPITDLTTYAQTYSELAIAPEVVGEDVDATGIVDPQKLEEVVNTEVSTTSPLFKVIASSQDPDDASKLANTIGNSIEDRTANLADNTGYRAKVVARAEPSERPAWPNLMLNIAVGAGVGLLLGAIAALIWDDRRRAYGK